MKKTILTLLSVLFCAITFAQNVPQGINYQAIARDAAGAELANDTLAVQFSIITSGSVSWQENHTVTTNNFGLFTAIIGNGTTTNGGSSITFDLIDWGAAAHSLKVEIDYGNGYLDMGTNDFMSVPYSLHAKTAANGSTTDELQSLRLSGDTLFIEIQGLVNSGNWIILTTPILLGCTDSTAFNYNALANTDDSSCIINGCTDVMITVGGGSNNSSIAWSLVDGLGVTVASGGAPYSGTACLTDDCYTMNMTDSYGYGWNGATYSITNNNSGTVYGTGGLFGNASWTVDSGFALVSIGTACLLGCTDSLYTEFDTSANADNGSCATLVVNGCTDPLYTEYNPLANTDNGSCATLVVNGCTDPTAFNYNAAANTDDGSCIAVVNGCTDPTAFNYNLLANTDDGSCIAVVNGCTDSLYTEYDPLANTNDGSCTTLIVNGCTDSTATNYNALANTDDGSCIFPPFSGAIGDTYQGGIVFWLDGNGGGLIAAPTDQSSGAQWGCEGAQISGADGTAIGTGNQNTIDIEAGCTTSGTAADICANLTLGGYSDWFLPSIDELNKMYLNIGQGNALGLGNIGGFANNYYWSSTEDDNYFAWNQSFTSGTQDYDYKDDYYSGRAVRAF